MAKTNGVVHHGDISCVLILGDNYAGSSIIHALSTSTNPKLSVHVAHPHEPSTANPAVTYHTHPSSQRLEPLLSAINPDLLISTSAGGSYEYQKSLIDAAITAGVPRFISAEFGHDSLNTRIQERLPPSKERARTIEYLKQRAKEGKISWVGLATGTTLDRGLVSGNLGFDVKWQSATLHGTGDETFPASSSSWIGKVVLAAIHNWDKGSVKNNYLHACSMLTTANDILTCFEQETGKEFEVGRQDVQQCVREAERRLEGGFPDAGMFLMERSVLYDCSLDAAGAFERGNAKEKLSLEGEQVDDIVRAVIHDLKHHGGGAGCGCD